MPELTSFRDIEESLDNARRIMKQQFPELETSYFPPSDEPLTWDIGSKLVTLETAAVAIHMMAARCCFRSFPAIVRQRMDKMKRGAAEKVAEKIAERTLAKIVANFLKWLVTFGEMWNATKMQKEIEQSIRRNAIKTMRETKELYLRPKAGKTRKRDVVYTRKKTEPYWSRQQRAANG